MPEWNPGQITNQLPTHMIRRQTNLQQPTQKRTQERHIKSYYVRVAPVSAVRCAGAWWRSRQWSFHNTPLHYQRPTTHQPKFIQQPTAMIQRTHETKRNRPKLRESMLKWPGGMCGAPESNCLRLSSLQNNATRPSVMLAFVRNVSLALAQCR